MRSSKSLIFPFSRVEVKYWGCARTDTGFGFRQGSFMAARAKFNKAAKMYRTTLICGPLSWRSSLTGNHQLQAAKNESRCLILFRQVFLLPLVASFTATNGPIIDSWGPQFLHTWLRIHGMLRFLVSFDFSSSFFLAFDSKLSFKVSKFRANIRQNQCKLRRSHTCVSIRSLNTTKRYVTFKCCNNMVPSPSFTPFPGFFSQVLLDAGRFLVVQVSVALEVHFFLTANIFVS